MLLATALAAEPEAAAPAADAPELAPSEAAPRPWLEYKLRPVLHHQVDTAFLDSWEPAFRRRNRMAAMGTGMLVGGFGMLVSGVIVANNGAPAGPTQAVVGGMIMVAGPIVGIHGTLGAARILRAGGVDVSRGFAWASVALLGTSIFGFTVPFVIPLATVTNLAQAEVNNAAFRQVMGRPPERYIAVVPTVQPHGAALALSGRW